MNDFEAVIEERALVKACELKRELEHAQSFSKELSEQVRERNDQIADLLYRLESQRSQRHHEVLCLVLKEGYRAKYNRRVDDTARDIQRDALEAADLAYPPPKQEPSE